MRVISKKVVQTRKPHFCWGCTNEIPSGSFVERTVCIDEIIISCYWCSVCSLVWDNLDYHDYADDGVGFGQLADYERELWESCKKRVKPEWELLK